MDAGQALGVAVAGSAVLSGLVIGGAELYRKLAWPDAAELEGGGDEEGRTEQS